MIKIDELPAQLRGIKRKGRADFRGALCYHPWHHNRIATYGVVPLCGLSDACG